MGNEDLGAGVVGGILDGIGKAASEYVNVKMARQKLDMQQQELDSTVKYHNAQVDYLEGRGDLAGQQADAYRFLIKQANDKQQTQLDANNNMIDDAHQNAQQKAGYYQNLLNNAVQTPETRDYMSAAMGGSTEATGMPQGEGMGSTPSPSAMGNPVVNTVMPGVGASMAPSKFQVPTSSYGLGRQMNLQAGYGQPAQSQKRNASLQKAMGAIDAMGIDSREDAQYALEKYYGADWAQNPDAVAFMNQKFGAAKPNIPNGSPGQQGAPGIQQGNDMVPVTGPDGLNYRLPRANLQKALQRGYRVRQ